MAEEMDLDFDMDINKEEDEQVLNTTDETLHNVSQALEPIAMQQQTEIEGGGNINLFNMSDDMTPFNVNLDEPISEIIYRATSGVRSDNFHLELKDGTRLEPNTTLRESGVVYDANIRLVEGEISLDSGISSLQSPAGSNDSLFVNENAEKESVVDESELDKLLEQGMSDTGMIVITQTDESLQEVSVNKSDTVNEVLTRVVGEDNEEFDLIENNRPLPRRITIRDAGIPFRDAGIPFGRNLKLRERESQIFVRLVDGRNIIINARRSQTVLFLKERLRDQIQVPLHQQRLQFQSKPLEDHRTLKSYGIRNNSCVESTYRLRGGFAY